MADDSVSFWPKGAVYILTVSSTTIQFGTILNRAGSLSVTEYLDTGDVTGANTTTNVTTIASPWSYDITGGAGGYRYTGAAQKWDLEFTFNPLLSTTSTAIAGWEFFVGLNGSSLGRNDSRSDTDDMTVGQGASLLSGRYKANLVFVGNVANGDKFTIFADSDTATGVTSLTNYTMIARPIN